MQQIRALSASAIDHPLPLAPTTTATLQNRQQEQDISEQVQQCDKQRDRQPDGIR